MKKILCSAVFVGLVSGSVEAISIVVDYSYDTNNFFDSQDSRDALQAAADRFSSVITSSLEAVTPGGTGTGTSAGWRIGFSHPGSGASMQISTAADSGTDPLAVHVGAADDYGFAGLGADTWVLFAGGRSLGGAAGRGGTGTGTNFGGTFNDVYGPMHRGFDDNTVSATATDLPRWGGVVSFDTAHNWHFGIDSEAAWGETDFYSIALHEIGHALGLASGWNQWADDIDSDYYLGAAALAAYNAENGTSLTALDQVGGGNEHWADGSYNSQIFADGNPNLTGTVGLGAGQDLLMEPTANFDPSTRRFELTDVDVAALQDLGWSVVPEPGQLLLGLLGVAGMGLRRRR